MNKLKIGLLPLYVKLYDDVSPEMRPRIEAFLETIKAEFLKRDIELITASICRLENEFSAAISDFEKNDVDCIVTLHQAYSPSLESVKSLSGTKLPIVILDTTETYDFTFNDDDTVITYNHGIHGVQDMCNLLLRNKKKFFIEAGHWQNSDVIDRVLKRVEGIKIAKSIKTARVGKIGESFQGMGDFAIPNDILKKTIGVEVIDYDFKKSEDYLLAVTSKQIEDEIAKDKKDYVVENIDESLHRTVSKTGLAIRKWISDNKLSAFTVNFLAITRASGLGCMPFTEINKEMANGIGYAGEGDVLTAALVGALASVYSESSFIEMFCPDWEQNLIFISHMGEMNSTLTSEKPRFLKKIIPFTDVTETAFLCGTFKDGSATLVNLAPAADNKFNLITASIKVHDMKPSKAIKDSICGWLEPDYSIGDFLTAYSKSGGTHHLAMVYGDVKKALSAFADVMEWNYIDISSQS